MFPSSVFLLCAFCCQVIHSHTPAGLRTLATLHNHRAKALANALNMRARAHYNAAVAKTRVSNLGIYDHRFIRDSSNNFVSEEREFEPEINEDLPIENDSDGNEEVLFHQSQNFENSNEEQGTDDVTLQQRNSFQPTEKDFIENQQNRVNSNHAHPFLVHQLRENVNPSDDVLQIPLEFDDLNGFDQISIAANCGDDALRKAADSQEVNGIGNEECQTFITTTRSQKEVDDSVMDSRKKSADAEDFRLPFGQTFVPIYSDLIERIAEPNMQVLPSGSDFKNSFDAIPTPLSLQSILNPHRKTFEIGDNEDIIKADSDESHFEPQMRPEEDLALSDFEESRSEKSAMPNADPHIRPHGHIFTHSHSHFHGIQPLQPNIQVPATHAAAGINLNVVQNQNAAVAPQFATTAIQPGFNTAIINNAPLVHTTGNGILHNVNTGYGTGYIHPSTIDQFLNTNSGQGVHQIAGQSGISQAQTIQTHSSSIMPSTQQFAHNLGGGGISQTQSINTHSSSFLPNNQQLLVTPNLGGNSVSQTQIVHQSPRVRERQVGLSDLKSSQQEIFDESALGKGNFGDEKVGTFLSSAPMHAPEFHFDPTQPENRQGIINYIENEQDSIRRFLHNNQYIADHQYNNEPINMDRMDEFGLQFDNNGPDTDVEENYMTDERNSGSHLHQLNHANFQDDRLGTFNAENLSDNLEVFDAELRRNIEAEEKSVQDALDEIGENYRRNMDSLSTLITGHGQRRTLNPTHFQNTQADSNGQIQIQDVDIPDGHQFETFGRSHQFDKEEREAQEDIKKSGMSQKVLEKNSDLHKTDAINPVEDRLGYIIQVPDRRYSEEYQRQARSSNQTEMVKLDKLLLEEKNIINELKKDAKHDEDLMMIGYIGDSLIEDLQNRLNKTRREKREIGRNRNLSLSRLVSDPRAKFDMSKTLKNIGAVTRNAFEHEKAPLYHVRNMVGAAQNAVMAAMKIPTKNFLIPSEYDIVYTQRDNERVGAINPSIFSRSGGETLREERPIDGIMDTFQRVGSAIRGSVISGQEAISHVGDIANHAKNAIHSTRYTAPRLVPSLIPAITRESKKKAVLITPRIFDISEEDNRVGNTLGKTQPDFVKMGHILDAVGVSNPNYKNVELEQIVIEPRSSFFDSSKSSDMSKFRRPNAFKQLLESIRVERIKNGDEEDLVGNSMNILDKAKSIVGANSLKDFIAKIKHEMKKLLGNATPLIEKKDAGRLYDKKPQDIEKNQALQENLIENQVGASQKIQIHEKINNQDIEEQEPVRQQNRINYSVAENQPEADQETVGASLLPEEIQHPFLGQATLDQRKQFIRKNNGDEDVLGSASKLHKQCMKENNYEEYANQEQQDKDLGQILGAINPMMFERIFNETLKVNNHETPHSIFHHHHNRHSHGNHQTKDMNSEDQVGTGMEVKGQIAKPFMGQASNKQKHDFFTKYMPEDKQENYDEDDEENCSQVSKFEDLPDTLQWTDIFHPFRESIEYDK